jgi:DMSO/TMAO reductase YedYZ molybdopterin-dependent catalytic subunit
MSEVPPVTMVQPERAEAPPARGPVSVPRGLAAISGIVAALAALGVGELFAGLIAGVPSPIAAVGSAVIDFAPPGSKDFMVSLFGTNDKTALTVVVVAVVVLVGALVGLLARRSYGLAIAVILGFVGVGLLASLRVAGTSMTLVLVSAAIQAGVAIFILDALLTAARAAGRDDDRIAGPNSGRRSFLVRAGALGALAVFGGWFGRSMLEGRAAQVTAAVTEIPPPTVPAAIPGPDASFAIDGLTPLIVPNDEFYRIDTALITPAVGLDGWTLRVFGMVDKEVSLTFADLMQLPLVEQYVTIACVSNEVGGNLVGNTKWTGVRLADVLEMAGVQPGATQIVPRSVDGWTAGFPTAWITDPSHPREAMIAVEMDGVPLPAEHGFPARMIVPGLYGYVSATKWLAEIELTTLESFDAYWVPRGWSKLGPILTQSRIDVPASGSTVKAGVVPVAGVAWAPDRGISKVEISVDGGDWQAATLATEIGPQTWVQWKVPWQATTGQHVIEVRATDGTGEVQTAQVSPPPPDGARGHHQIAVQVS